MALKVWIHTALGCNHPSFPCLSYNKHVIPFYTEHPYEMATGHLLPVQMTGRSTLPLFIRAPRSTVIRSCVARSCVARSYVARSCVARSYVARSFVARSCVARSYVARSFVARFCVARSYAPNHQVSLYTFRSLVNFYFYSKLVFRARLDSATISHIFRLNIYRIALVNVNVDTILWHLHMM